MIFAPFTKIKETCMSKQDSEKYLLESIRLAMGNVKGRESATWPFGAVLVREGKVLARAVNQVDDLCDPTAHAEMQALRIAARPWAAPICPARSCMPAAIPAPCATPPCCWPA
jgi:tRNA(Arg) A34 adenosine deaminase TadA